MKKIIVTLLVFGSLSIFSQEAVFLRTNLKKGDTYLMKIEQKQEMGAQGGMNMNIEMDMSVTESDGKVFKTESKISTIAMDMLQAGNVVSFDSKTKDEDLDEVGRMMKGQFAPMMQAKITTILDDLGQVEEVKIEPSIPGMDQLANQSSAITFPKEKVSLGSTWSSEDENQGIKINTTYKVVKIENGIVFVEIAGTISGNGEGTLKGNTEIDLKTGMQKIGVVEMIISANGAEMKMTSKITTEKL